MYILPDVVSKSIVAASIHGVIDLKKPLWTLTPYLYCLTNIDPFVTQVVFVPCSIVHFSRDNDINTSIFLHLLWASVSKYDYDLAWILFTFYYTYHCFKTIEIFGCDFLYILYVIVFLLFPSIDIEVTNIMTKIIVSHILSDELTRNSTQHENIT